jgi:hypothetical protein
MSALILFLVIAFGPPQSDCKPQFAPLETGTSSGASELDFWRKEEAGEWGGEGWLGWTWKSDTLEPVRLVVRHLPKERPDDQGEVTVESFPDVTFALRCIPGLSAGRIQNAGVVNHELHHDGPREILLGARRYHLRLQSAREDLFDAKVILTEGQQTQVLYSADGFADDPHFQIIWAGDLDRDGKLDLVVNLHRKYSWHPYQLLLSSRAAPGELVGQAAVFVTGD